MRLVLYSLYIWGLPQIVKDFIDRLSLSQVSTYLQ